MRSNVATKQRQRKKDRTWFELKVAELKTELEKLSTDRKEQLAKDLEPRKEN